MELNSFDSVFHLQHFGIEHDLKSGVWALLVLKTQKCEAKEKHR